MQRALVHNVAVLGAALGDLAVAYLAGEGTDMALFATLANAQRRLLGALGLERRAVDVSSYLPSGRGPMGEGIGDPPHPAQEGQTGAADYKIIVEYVAATDPRSESFEPIDVNAPINQQSSPSEETVSCA